MVDRFQMKTEHDWICARADEKGDWVRHSDYAALSAELERVKGERDTWKERAGINIERHRAEAKLAGGEAINDAVDALQFVKDDPAFTGLRYATQGFVLSALTHPAPTHEDAGVMVHYGNSTAPGRPFEPSSHTSGSVTEAMVEAAADEIVDAAEIDFNGTILNRAEAALEAALRGEAS